LFSETSARNDGLVLAVDSVPSGNSRTKKCVSLAELLCVPAKVFKCGQRIPASGIYRVIHAQHRLPQEVKLVKGEVFPRCMECGEVVRFRMVRLLTEVNGLREKIILNAIPEIPKEEAAPIPELQKEDAA
jgi:hypothetical protein